MSNLLRVLVNRGIEVNLSLVDVENREFIAFSHLTSLLGVEDIVRRTTELLNNVRTGAKTLERTNTKTGNLSHSKIVKLTKPTKRVKVQLKYKITSHNVYLIITRDRGKKCEKIWWKDLKNWTFEYSRSIMAFSIYEFTNFTFPLFHLLFVLNLISW